MTKQTAVEWLQHQLNLTGKTHFFSLRELIEQALQIEKEQIENAYWDGGQDVPANVCRCEEYYNQTYGGES